jgi:Bacterial protein of unknown function (DUF839)
MIRLRWRLGRAPSGGTGAPWEASALRRAALLAAGACLFGFTKGPLTVGPGSGVHTSVRSMVRPLREDVSITPILSVGDTLFSPDTTALPFVFAPLPDGIGVRATGKGLAEVLVAHELPWNSIGGGARVSRLAIDLRNLGVLAGDYLVDGTEGYSRFCSAGLAGPREGFLAPKFLVNEESVDAPFRGLVAAVDARDGTVTDLPWLGRFSHGATAIVPVSSGKCVAILTEDSYPGRSQLYMYVADNDAAFLEGRGQLYVFRANAPSGRRNTRLSSLASKSTPLTGTFVPIEVGDASGWVSPEGLELRAQSAGSLNFVRLEDAGPDRREPNAFFFVDTGAESFSDPETARPVTRNGRVYSARLDPFDPTRVVELRVLLDGDEADDLYRPDDLDGDDRYLWIQEDPGSSRGLHTARILRYDTETRRLETMAECAELDPKGRELPRGVGGIWASTGIVNADEIFGPDSWLIAVQAPNLRLPELRARGGGGQLLLLRGPGSGKIEKKPKPKREARTGTG